MARPKTLTEEQKKSKAAAYQRERRAKLKATGKETTTTPRDPLAVEVKRVQDKIALRGQTLLASALAQVNNGKAITEVMASFVDAAGKDPETEALVTLLAVLQRATSVRDSVAAGKWQDVVVPNAVDSAKTKPKTKTRKRA